MTPDIIGARAPKLDAPAKVSGQPIYGHDLTRPRMLHAKILRSPHPSARIVSIDISRAQRLPGVRAILTGRDLPSRRFGFGLDNSILKADYVRRVGDEVAAVAAVDAQTAWEAARLIQVEYELLPAVFDPVAALAPDAIRVHPDRESNLFRRQVYQHGEVEAGLAEADVVVEDTFELPYVANAPLEPSFCLAEFEANGDLTIYSTTQVPFLMQREIANAVDFPASRVRVVQTAVGGSFGRSLDLYPYEPICVLLARQTGRPVRIAFDRQEEFLAAPVRQPLLVVMRSAAKRDGTLWARDAQACLNIGAYASWGAVTTLVMAETFGSLYRVPHARFIADLVYTHGPVTGAMRGFGNPQATFCVESHMDRLAHALDMDPVDFRQRNANRPHEATPQGLKISTCGLRECLEMVAARADTVLERAEGSGRAVRRGIGFASTLNVGGGARTHRSDGCGAVVKVDDFGRVTLITGASEIGQGADISLAQIVAATLGVTLAAVRVVNGDTAHTPWDVGVHASRTTFVAGNAARLAALDARRQILETAAVLLRTTVETLDCQAGQVFVQDQPERTVALDKVVRARHYQSAGQDVVGTGWYDPPNEMVTEGFHGNLSATYSFGAHAAEVKVDTETGRVRVLRVYAAHDVGRAINPMLIEGQIEGGIHMGIGYALSERLLVQDGRVVNDSLREYGIATALDMPSIVIDLVETHDPLGPFGAKGVGEMGVTPVAAAIANAVYDAIGTRITSLPITPEKVLQALDQKT